MQTNGSELLLRNARFFIKNVERVSQKSCRATATVGQKVGGGLTSAVIGWLLDASGFTGLVKEIPSAVAMVSNLYIWGTILAWGLIVVLMLMYKLDKEYGTIIDEMEKKGMLAQTK